jgi:vancomycin resistance protein VanW
MLKRPQWIPRPLSTYNPAFYNLAIWMHRCCRWLEWRFDDHRYARTISNSDLPYRVKKHKSVLVRHYKGVDLTLQLNKVENLRIVVNRVNGLLLRPGETFSFCQTVGKPSRRRGFKEGIELSRGTVRPGIGGGICQASNLLYWLAIHTPLTIIERHHHSFDPFPDTGRVLPFASGATVMYNYRDLRLHNPTPYTFQVKLWLDEKFLNGDLRCSGELRYSYQVFEKNHRFECLQGQYLRRNELWRRVIDKHSGGMTIKQEHLVTNCAEVKYVPSPERLEASTSIQETGQHWT